MNLGIKDRTALVLAAGDGLGASIARTLGGEGAQIAVADVDATSARATVDAINSAGGTAIAFSWDLSDLASINENITRIESHLAPVDILVNITPGPPPTPASGQDAITWETHFRSMVLSVMSVTDRVLPGMCKRQWGRIITSTSSGVIAPIPNLAISNALRLSLVGWSKTLAREVARDGVTANVVVPGRIATRRITLLDEKKAEREGRSVDEVTAESIAAIPLARYGKPQEYADVVTFLASERASYITGSVIRVDGGLIPNI